MVSAMSDDDKKAAEGNADGTGTLKRMERNRRDLVLSPFPVALPAARCGTIQPRHSSGAVAAQCALLLRFQFKLERKISVYVLGHCI
jgi:hypothetical protein